MKKKIVMFEVFNDPNLGDKLLCFSAGRIVGSICDAEIEYVDFYGREALSPKYPRVKEEKTIGSVNWSRTYEFFHKFLVLMSFMPYPVKELGCHIEWLTDPNRKKRLEKYYTEVTKDADMVIVPGGGILENSVEHDYYHNILLMTEICEKRGIPMCFNAVGIVKDKRARIGDKLLKKALNSECVKYISCRDGKEVIKSYIGKEVKTVACAATMAGDLFDIKKRENSDKIGVGVIRGNIFKAYGYDFDEEKLISFYVDLINEIEKRGYEAVIFCNGFVKDYELGLKVEERLGKKLSAKRPENVEELLEIVADCRAICAARLHATIAAYSLDVPAVVFSWGTKQADFMRKAGCEERAVAHENMTGEYVAKILDEAIEKGWNEEIRRDFTLSGRESIAEILEIGGFIDG